MKTPEPPIVRSKDADETTPQQARHNIAEALRFLSRRAVELDGCAADSPLRDQLEQCAQAFEAA